MDHRFTSKSYFKVIRSVLSILNFHCHSLDLVIRYITLTSIDLPLAEEKNRACHTSKQTSGYSYEFCGPNLLRDCSSRWFGGSISTVTLFGRLWYLFVSHRF